MPLVFEGEGVEIYIYAEEQEREAHCFDSDLNEVIVNLDTLKVNQDCGEVNSELSNRAIHLVEEIQIYLLVMWEQLSKPARD